MKRSFLLLVALASLRPAVARAVEPVPAAAREAPGILRHLDGALAELAARVSPAVVQILVSGYGPASAEDGQAKAAFIVPRRAVGSGVIVDPSGYVVTNAHVVEGARRVVVVLPVASASGSPLGADAAKRPVYQARVVGTHPESDIAVLKIEATGLPFLPLRDTIGVKPGELVIAVGSPHSLASTITMGIVSSVARQVDLDAPISFIQTDAPINPGNSGGPLVNVDGEVVGINTFILSGSGGSEGLGFAVPAPVVSFVYDGLRTRGYVRRVEVGIAAQAITPQLAGGLGLPRDTGVIVSDVAPGGPADAAGVHQGDVLEEVDGRRIDSVPDLVAALHLTKNTCLRVRVLRAGRTKELEVRAVALDPPLERTASLADPDGNLVRQLGAVVVDVDDNLQQTLRLRQPGGVVVVARTLDGRNPNGGLQPGDAIRAVNRVEIRSVAGLRHTIERLRTSPVVLQIEREGRFRYLVLDPE